MKRHPNTVTDEFSDNREAVRFNMPLDRVTDIRHVPPDPHLLDGKLKRAACHSQQVHGSVGNVPHRHRDRRVPIEPVEHHTHVERDDIPLNERRRRRNPVHDRVVH